MRDLKMFHKPDKKKRRIRPWQGCMAHKSILTPQTYVNVEITTKVASDMYRKSCVHFLHTVKVMQYICAPFSKVE